MFETNKIKIVVVLFIFSLFSFTLLLSSVEQHQLRDRVNDFVAFFCNIVNIVAMNRIGRIGFLGGGKIAQAMAKGFIKAGIKHLF